MARRRNPVHPGTILRDEFLVPRGQSSNRLGEVLHVPANRISDILRGRRGITADTALRLGRHFRTTPEYWMDLQRDFELETTRQEIGRDLKTIRMAKKQ